MRHRTLNGFAVLPAASFNTRSSYSVLCPNHSSLQIPSHFAEGKISVIMWEWMCPTSSEMFSNSSHNSFCPLSEVVCGEQVLLSLPHLVSWDGTISKIKIKIDILSSNSRDNLGVTSHLLRKNAFQGHNFFLMSVFFCVKKNAHLFLYTNHSPQFIQR